MKSSIIVLELKAGVKLKREMRKVNKILRPIKTNNISSVNDLADVGKTIGTKGLYENLFWKITTNRNKKSASEIRLETQILRFQSNTRLFKDDRSTKNGRHMKLSENTKRRRIFSLK